MLTCDALAKLNGVRHGFFTRGGGVSLGLYASLNCGPGSSDDPAAVRENRRRAAAAFGQPEEALHTLRQAHGKDVAVIGEIPVMHDGNRPPADALVTRHPGLVLGILAADCAPVLLADADARVIGAAHAGWRGARGGVLEAALEAMDALGAARGRIVAAIGPCIGPESYEVDEAFLAPFLAESEENRRFFLPAETAGGRKFRFDLPGYVAWRLAAGGVAHVTPPPYDTYAEETLFFSYRRATLRREPDYGRQISCITLENAK